MGASRLRRIGTAGKLGVAIACAAVAAAAAARPAGAAVCPAGPVLRGVDVSVYQGAPNWLAIAASGVSFGYARIGLGAGYSDPTFAADVAGMRAAGLKTGGYLMFDPAQDPVAQANAVLSALSQVGFAKGDLVPVLDVEITGGRSAATIAAALKTASATIASALGTAPVIYTAPGWWNGNVGSTQFGANPLWVANWGVICPSVPNGWSSWAVWQYADNGTVSGIAGAVDLDEATAASLPVYGAPPPPPPPGTTTLAFTPSSATSGDYHDPVSVQAILSDAAGPVAGRSISFSFGAFDGVRCWAVTDANGVATCPSIVVQTGTLTASFEGDTTRLSSSASTPFTVLPEETQLVYTGTSGSILDGSTATLSATLTEDGTTPIVGGGVQISLGSQLCQGTNWKQPGVLFTDANGTATCSLSVSQPLGPTTISASIAPVTLASYRPSTATADALLYAFPAFGAFVVAPPAEAEDEGSGVTWWGHDWADRNHLPAADGERDLPEWFMGFAGAAQPVCGGTWAARPGELPPAAVPSYMGVLVAGPAAASHGTITGSVAHVVVVKTDPGYAPDPGHAGTGTIVGPGC